MHIDRYHNGIKLVSATELATIIDKPFIKKWQTKLCQCKTHKGTNKSPFKETEITALKVHGYGHCGLVYADYVKDNAGDLGNEVHSLMEDWFKHGRQATCIETDSQMWADKIIDIYKEHKVKQYLIEAEGTMIDTESGLAGSPDTVAMWDGEPAILDTKIKNQLDDLTDMQGCAYRYLLRRKFGVDIKTMIAIWCQKESKGKLVKPVVFDLDKAWPEWVSLVTLWNKLHPRRKVLIHES